jgi:nitroreductase
MELSDTVRRRTMVRSFSGQPVPAPVLDRLLELACRAPSAGNTGGWDAVVLVGDQTAAFWHATTTPQWRGQARRWPGLARAPVVIALFVDPGSYLARYAEPDKTTSGLGPGEPETAGGSEPGDRWPVPYWFVDGGFAVMTMLLGAADAGLGACFLGNFRGETALRAALGVPEDRRYLGAVLMGSPGGDDPPSSSLERGPRRLSQVVHRGQW